MGSQSEHSQSPVEGFGRRSSESDVRRGWHLSNADIVAAIAIVAGLIVVAVVACIFLDITKREAAFLLVASAPAFLVAQHGLQLRFFRPVINGANKDTNAGGEAMLLQSMPSGPAMQP